MLGTIIDGTGSYTDVVNFVPAPDRGTTAFNGSVLFSIQAHFKPQLPPEGGSDVSSP